MEHQFDELAKALAEGMSRREALRRVGGGLAAALLVSLGWSREAWGETRAACKSLCAGLKGKHGNQCISVCMSCSSASCVTGSPGAKTCLHCTGGKICSNGTCECPLTLSPCDGGCVDTATDTYNCGACASDGGAVCGGNQLCVAGSCICGQNATKCGSGCCPLGWDSCITYTAPGLECPNSLVCEKYDPSSGWTFRQCPVY